MSSIHIQRNGFSDLLKHCPLIATASQVVLISHPSLIILYGTQWKHYFKQAGLSYLILEIPEGENSKCFAQASRCWRFLIKHQIDRQACLLAFGGGVICDLVGFVASQYLRGIASYYIPTSLMGMVDAAIGGKTGINAYGRKNCIGSFYFPQAVLIDSQFLKTLPLKELRSGLAEVIKYGVIEDPNLFAFLEKNFQELKNPLSPLFDLIIQQCVQIKQNYTNLDPLETTGKRALLNYGHTMGHALEAITKYQSFSHGEAVAIGMQCAGQMSLQMGLTTQEIVQRQKHLIERLELPTQLPSLSISRFMQLLKSDKKSVYGKIHLILLKEIGKVLKVTDVDSSLVKKCLLKCMTN